MATTHRSQVFSLFKKLHRTRQLIFSGDVQALTEARNKINTEFKERSRLEDPIEIDKSIQMGVEAEMVLRKTIVQAEQKDPESDVFAVKVTSDTIRNDNAKIKVGDVPSNIRDLT